MTTFKKNKEYRGENVMLENVRRVVLPKEDYDTDEQFKSEWYHACMKEAELAEKEGLESTAEELRKYAKKPELY